VDESESTADEPAGSVTRWIGELKAGTEEPFSRSGTAITPGWSSGPGRSLVRSATPVNDEDDVASSAFHSLYQGLREGRFPRLEDRDDLWRLLVHLAACKAVDRHRAEHRRKRGGGKILSEADMVAARADGDDEGNPLDRIIGSEPSPEFAAMVAEEYRRRLEGLGDATLRRIAELKLACYSNEEIRQQLGCSLRSVTLKLELIRKKWQWVKGPP